jgi:hypothetical protein
MLRLASGVANQAKTDPEQIIHPQVIGNAGEVQAWR